MKKDINVVFVFDHSSCHGAYAKNALNASKMNAQPGGKEPLMRDTMWNAKTQKMVFDDSGITKGLIQMLKDISMR